MSTAELIRGIVSPFRTRRSSASFDGRVFVGSIPTLLYIVRTAADSAGGEMRTLASASASSGSSRCSCRTTVAPVHQIAVGRTIDASSGETASDTLAGEPLEEAVVIPLGPRRPVGDLGHQCQIDLAEIFGGIAIDRLIEIVARGVVTLGAPLADELMLRRVLRES